MQVQGASPAQSPPLPAQAASALTPPTPTKQSTPLTPTASHAMTTPAAPPAATATHAPARPVPPAPPAQPQHAVPTQTPVPAPPAHTVEAVPHAATVTAAETTSPAPPATAPAVAAPVKDVTDNSTAGHNTPIDTEAETKLTAEIVELWGVHRDGKATVRRTRAELKALRLELGAKLHTMKSILVRTGRGGGWAAYLRSQRLPLATADKYVVEHAASLTRPEEKLLEEELSKPTVDQVRQLAQKLLPKLCDVLTTAELVHGFIDELFWSLEAAVGRETDDGLEVFRASHQDATAVKVEAAELAEPASAVP
jgi:hypothetical protein